MKQLFNNISPKAAVAAGALGGILTLCTIGFFILLGIMISGSSIDKRSQPVVSAKQGDGGVQPSPQPAATGIQLKSITDGDWYKGGKDAPITIVEFSDTECPFCKRFHTTMNQVVTEYGDKIKWVYKHAPLDSLHKKARKEAEAFECAGELGGNDGFWKYADRLFEVTPSNDGLPESELLQIAADVGLNGSSFEKCLASGKYAAKVQQHLDEAITAGLRGTPYSILIAGENVIPISGAQPFEQVKSIIDSVR